MPFDFLKRKKDAPDDRSTSRPGRPVGRGVPFDGLTEEWRIVGEMHIPGRLSDALNKREAIDDLGRPLGAGRRVGGAVAGARPQGRRPVRPDPRAGRRGDPAAADRRRADGLQGPQDPVRRGARGAAVPGRRHGLPDPGLGAGAAAGPGDRDVRPGRRRDGLPRRAAARRARWTRSSSIASTCAASSRSTGGPASARRQLPGAPLGGTSWQDRSR